MILAGITIVSLTESGLFSKTQLAKTKAQKEEINENLKLILMEIYMQEQEQRVIFTPEEIANKIESAGKGYKKIKVEEDNITVEKEGYKFVVKAHSKQETNNTNQTDQTTQQIVIPEELELPTFNYNNTSTVESLNITIEYPEYASKKLYKIGNGSWKTYTKEITLIENAIIYAKYESLDERYSEEVSKTISNILNSNINNYTNASTYMSQSSEIGKIEAVNKLFNLSYLHPGTYTDTPIYFLSWCSGTVYFQDNKAEPIEATKIVISSSTNERGCEPIKDFYITASNTIDFLEETEIYRGTHTSKNGIWQSEHTFESKGSYQFYRLYVTSWYEFNECDGQNIGSCHIEEN